ncbi:MAG: 50S ribosomal protein L29 [Alphaproteobacteria bacterium]|nr:50S ribosomal protein L29 [Alphaproteobacteria bacterium]
MKTSELRGKAKEELTGLVVSSKKELFNLRMQAATGADANLNRAREVKKTIARAKTLLNEQTKTGKNSAPKKAAGAKSSAKKVKE